MERFIKYHIPVMFWCTLIFALSSIPGLKITESGWDLLLRKGAHVFMYFVLFLLSYRALIYAGPKNFSIQLNKPEIWAGGLRLQGLPLYFRLRAAFVVAFIFSALYALSDEFHQRFVPERSGNLSDFLIDIS